MNDTLFTTILNRLKREYSLLESQEEKIEFGLKYAGKFMLNSFIQLMEEIEIPKFVSLFKETQSDLDKLLFDKEYQKEYIEYLKIKNPSLYEECLKYSYRLSVLANRLFNVKPDERIVRELSDNLVVPKDDIDKFYENIKKVAESLKEKQGAIYVLSVDLPKED